MRQVEIGALAPAEHDAAPAGRAGACAGGGSDHALTPLGQHLASLPLDVRLAKALIFGALLRCADPILTVAAALSERTPFRPLPFAMDAAERGAVEAARAQFAWGQSDHLAIVKAFDAWRDAGASGGAAAQRALCDAAALSHDSLRSMADLRDDYAGTLADMGFLPGGGGGGGGARRDGGAAFVDGDTPMEGRRGGTGGRRGGASGEWGRYGERSPAANACSRDVNVIRAALVAGLYPHVVKVVT